MIEIRNLSAGELAQVEAVFSAEGDRAKHAERLARQAQGRVDYLIAWEGPRPVGHALLNWDGSGDEPVRSRLEPLRGRLEPLCPDVEDLLTRAEMRGQGIGTLLLAEAERRAAGKGCRRIGLSVDSTENPGARRLYERLGYRDAGFGEYMEGGEYLDEQGARRTWEAVCVYLIKVLE